MIPKVRQWKVKFEDGGYIVVDAINKRFAKWAAVDQLRVSYSDLGPIKSVSVVK